MLSQPRVIWNGSSTRWCQSEKKAKATSQDKTHEIITAPIARVELSRLRGLANKIMAKQANRGGMGMSQVRFRKVSAMKDLRWVRIACYVVRLDNGTSKAMDGEISQSQEKSPLLRGAAAVDAYEGERRTKMMMASR
jgi:hypothetical protein